MVHPQTAMLGWTSASVPLVLYPTYDSRHPTRTQYPGDVPPVGAMPLGHPRRLRVLLSSYHGSVCIRYSYLRLETEGNSWRHDVGFKQVIFWLRLMDSFD